ncbi:MAG: hypothetical protein ABIP94_17610 [Planctomycetota bacterium]
MTNITVQELKQAMAAALRRVGLGQWLTVLKHGKPVARLGPPTESDLHIGKRYASGDRIVPLGRRLSRGAYLDVLSADRSGEDK